MALDIKYQTGVLWQDTQHTEWINLLDTLESSRKDSSDSMIFDQALSFLVMYVNHHFKLEEEYMKKYDYPEKRFHMEEHRLYILRLKDFRDKQRQDEGDVCGSIIESMKNWIFSHIMENDQKLGKFILKTEYKLNSNVEKK